jgi:L-lysine exporter family protein LysE/ArgO
MSDIIIASLHGIFLAMGLILPLGVQNIFIFNQGATQKSLFAAFPSVISASICDTILIIAAISGMSAIFLEHHTLKLVILVMGFFFLAYMGFVTWNKTTGLETKEEALSPKQQILFAISVSILNPHAIIDSVAVIGTNSLHYHSYAKIAFAISCVSVSWVWFFALAFVGKYVKHIDKNGIYIYFINKFAAIIVWVIAFYLLISILDM